MRITCDFPNPSRLEDVLTITLHVEKIGSSSVTLNVTAICQEEVRFQARPILAFIDQESGKSIRIPDDLRASIEKYRYDR